MYTQSRYTPEEGLEGVVGLNRIEQRRAQLGHRHGLEQIIPEILDGDDAPVPLVHVDLVAFGARNALPALTGTCAPSAAML
jgi:hypothetical protein